MTSTAKKTQATAAKAKNTTTSSAKATSSAAQKKYQTQKKTTQSTLQVDNSEQAQVTHLLDTRGLVGVMIIIILEMATPIGILFPTDAIVFGSGLYFSAKWNIPWGIWTLMILFIIAVTLWDILGYFIGKAFSAKIAVMQDNWFFKKKYLTMCQHYFDDYGNKTMIVSKFLPIRSIIPLVAGVILKPFTPFVLQSLLSAVLWIGALVWISYLLITLIPATANHIGLLTFLFVVVPQVVSVWYMIKPMMKKYEARIAQASQWLQHIESELSAIGSQFATIGHEIKDIVDKVVTEEPVWTETAPNSLVQNTTNPTPAPTT